MENKKSINKEIEKIEEIQKGIAEREIRLDEHEDKNEDDIFNTQKITSYYRLIGMLETISECGLNMTVAAYGWYDYFYFEDDYISNNSPEELKDKFINKYIHDDESDKTMKGIKKIFGAYLVQLCEYAKEIEESLFNNSSSDIDVFKIEDILETTIEELAEKYYQPAFTPGYSIENSLIKDFVSTIKI